MTSTIPGPARDFAGAVVLAVDTALGGHDAVTYDSAIVLLATEPAGGRVLGDLLRSLLEDTHPDGLDSQDITLVTGRCYRAATTWLPPERVDVTILLAVLAGALGIGEPGSIDETPPEPPHAAGSDPGPEPDDSAPPSAPTWPDYAWHAPLLIADLLPFAPATVSHYLEATFAEYAREAREDLP